MCRSSVSDDVLSPEDGGVQRGQRSVVVGPGYSNCVFTISETFTTQHNFKRFDGRRKCFIMVVHKCKKFESYAYENEH
jgi:hypothetical protein